MKHVKLTKDRGHMSSLIQKGDPEAKMRMQADHEQKLRCKYE